MPYLLEDLVIDRVDLVDEGSNSAAFVELYKGKETRHAMDVKEILSKMKPEHASVLEEAINKAKEETARVQGELEEVTKSRDEATENLKTANEELAKANSELEVLKGKVPCECEGEADESGVCKSCGKPKIAKASFDESEVLKGMPEAARQYFEKMKMQKEAAEEEVRKAKEAEVTAEAVAKAKELKALPVDEDKLVDIIKSASSDVLDLLATVNAAIEGTVLDEVGKSNAKGANVSTDANGAWAKIEAKADEVAKRDNITKAKAVSVVIKENPDLYKEYLQGGAN